MTSKCTSLMISKLSNHLDQIDSRLADWNEEERKFHLAFMRVWRRSSFAFSIIFAVIGIANVEMLEADWLLRFSILLAILYIWTTWVSRTFAEGSLIGPLMWIKRYPKDLFNVNG